MTLKEGLVYGAIALAVVLGVSYPGVKDNSAAIANAVLSEVESKLGATPGPDFLIPVSFFQTATIGGQVFATTSQGAVTYTAASLVNTQVIQHTASAALTATLPASSTIGFIPRAGDTRTFYLAPITTGITLAGGTGTDLNTASSTKFCVVSSLCELVFVRKTNSDIEVLLKSATGL